MSRRKPRSLRRRVAGQGALLMGGFMTAQACSFVRNALLAHALSKGDFGIAATLTLMLQLLETLSDLGADRLIVQASDGDDPAMQRVAHATLLARGVVMAAILLALAHPVAAFFRVPEATWAFQLSALVPLVKGFAHLDSRRLQRTLDNRAYMTVETAPQVAALALTVPVLHWGASYDAVVWLALVQAALAVLVSHAIAARPYAIGLDRALLARFVAFGWPIWLSAFPLVAVYQGDRLIAGRVLGMEALAGYSAAFMITMVPGLVASKTGHALMLPLLSEARANRVLLRRRVAMMAQVVTLAAALYLALFVIAGGRMLSLAFGPNFAGYGAVVGWLALMWALRMVQSVPGLTLMALGDTRPLLVAGLIRAGALLPAIVAVTFHRRLEALAAAGVAGEIASFLYIVWRTRSAKAGLASPVLVACSLLIPAAAAALAIAAASPIGTGTLAEIVSAGAVAALIAALGTLVMPQVRSLARSGLNRLRAGLVTNGA